jgi:hypothetical protein
VGAVSAEGWYRDPYAIHEDRWMSQGRPTKLVRDGGTEAYDAPPDLPLPDVLVPVTSDSSASPDGSDLQRSDGTGQDAYSDKRAARAALVAIGGGAIVEEPGGIW